MKAFTKICMLFLCIFTFGCSEKIEPEGGKHKNGADDALITFAVSTPPQDTRAFLMKEFKDGAILKTDIFQDGKKVISDYLVNDDGDWSLTNDYYWSDYEASYKGKKYLDCCFTYPAQTLSNTMSFDYTVGNTYDTQEDLLQGYLHCQSNFDNDPHTIYMYHALSMLDFYVKTADRKSEKYKYTLLGVYLINYDGFKNKGTYTMNSGWSNTSSTAGTWIYRPYIKNTTLSASTWNNVNYNDYLMILPQKIDEMTIGVVYQGVNGTTKITRNHGLKFDDVLLKENGYYKFEVTVPSYVDMADPYLIDGTKDWYAGNVSTRNITLYTTNYVRPTYSTSPTSDYMTKFRNGPHRYTFTLTDTDIATIADALEVSTEFFRANINSFISCGGCIPNGTDMDYTMKPTAYEEAQLATSDPEMYFSQGNWYDKQSKPTTWSNYIQGTYVQFNPNTMRFDVGCNPGYKATNTTQYTAPGSYTPQYAFVNAAAKKAYIFKFNITVKYGMP